MSEIIFIVNIFPLSKRKKNVWGVNKLMKP